jgi:uracil-DNA glycosylase
VNFDIEESWRSALADEFEKPYFAELTRFVRDAYASGACHPAPELIFNAFAKTPFDRVKAVILGQDPYHNPGQAHGLAFSVPDGVTPPPSLVNIYKELEAEGFGRAVAPRPPQRNGDPADGRAVAPRPPQNGDPADGRAVAPRPPQRNGDLTRWAEQGVLLLNATLTVADGDSSAAGSHQGKGWERFTDAVVRALAARRDGLVYFLWGAYAQKKAAFVDATKNLVLKSAHPSPLSARRGFFGCGHFKACNEYLSAHGKEPIRW